MAAPGSSPRSGRASLDAGETFVRFSPDRPEPDPDHEGRTARAVRRALEEIPFYLKRGQRWNAPDDASLGEALRALPLLFKKDVRAVLPKQWVPPNRDVRAELESGQLELVETSGSTGDRLRILWDRGWWPRQEARAMRTNPEIAAAMDGALGPYRESVLTTPACSLDTCHVGDLPYEDRKDETHLFLNTRTDPFYWTAADQSRMLDELARHGTVGLESDPLYLALLSHFARGAGRTLDVKGFVQLTYAFTTGACRRAIAEAFGGSIFQLYGASEVGVLFMEAHDGLLQHCPFTTHVELLRARVPTPGAEGVALVVVTTLDRVAMPLVRFVLGDLVQVSDLAPRPWTTVPALASVEGRVDEAVLRPDGALITAGAVDRALAEVEGLRLWQLNQRQADAVELDVVANGEKAHVVEQARERLSSLFAGMRLSARSAAAIPIEPSGKFRVAKRHFALDLARCFDGCNGAEA
jgi:phenylacetate-coenzyme A ligase PaaK-like adenylate-forming protein